MHRKTVGAVLVMCMLVFGVSGAWGEPIDPSAGQAPAATNTSSQWTFSLRPYLFLSGVAGSVTSGPFTVPINSEFGEVVKNLQFGGFLTFSGERGKWGFYSDFQYISLVGEGTGILESKLRLTNTFAEADITFRPDRAPTLRFLAGVRLYSINQTLSVMGESLPNANTTVFDPIIGAHGNWRLHDRWQFELRGDIGGFGVSSEFTYNLMALFHWQLSDLFHVPFGYRVLGYQIDTGGVQMSTRMSGMVLGLDFRF